jgi:molybdopterin converting factor small subunit
MRIRSLFRYAVLLAVSLLLALPARAVVPEKDFQSTLNSLLQELRQSYASAQESDTLMVNNREQREAFDRVLKSADEVTIMLYTQRPEFTFDMAFALEEVSRVKSAFHEQVLLNDQYRIAARSGLRRYELLNETLQDMPEAARRLPRGGRLARARAYPAGGRRPRKGRPPGQLPVLYRRPDDPVRGIGRPRAEGQRPLRGDRGPAHASP